jgi:hypothetical protein
MKSIINGLVALFIFGMFATGFAQKPQNSKQILLQSTNLTISQVALSQSADIMNKRLKSYSNEQFDVITIPAKRQIKVTLNDAWDIEVAANLVTTKGVLVFYETYFYKDLEILLKGDSTLFSLVQAKVPGDSVVRIVCTATEGKNKVDKYLFSRGTKENCKFAWSNLFDDDSPCLFALKSANGNGLNLKGSDIESFNLGQDATWKNNYLGFKFKKQAIPIWAEITKRNINRAIAIVLDDHVLFAPVVRDEIPGGNCQLSGGFSQLQLKYIVSVCENGELPVGFDVVK